MDAVAQDLPGRLDCQDHGVPLRRSVLDRADPIHMTRHQMSPDPVMYPHRPLKIDGRTRRQLSECRHREGLPGDLHRKFTFPDRHDGKAGSIDADTGARLEIVHHR